MTYMEEAKVKFDALKGKESVLILSVESSCDETSIALVENGRNVLANIVSSQIDIHKLYGGVVPEIASRNHIKNISGVLEEALAVSGKTLQDIDAVAVTYGAGLMGALLVGVNFAKTLAYSLKLPFNTPRIKRLAFSKIVVFYYIWCYNILVKMYLFPNNSLLIAT